MKKRHSFFKKFIKFIMFLIILFFIFNNLFKIDIFNNYKNNIGEHENPNYSYIGQEKVKDKDGYYTTFQTKSRKYIEYKQNGEATWSQKDYWGGTMEENGCGITSMSIILSGYGINVTPEELRKKYEPHLPGEDISKELKKYGLNCDDFLFSTAYFSKEYVMEHLKKDRPILICAWSKPNAMWTEKSHYMVLLATDGKDKIYVSNPNGSEKKNPSGWYEYYKVLPYIAKALFID